MTKQEFSELYESLFYGHEAELLISEKRYFLEWSNSDIDIYLMNGDDGRKISSIRAEDRRDALSELLEYAFDGGKKLINSYDCFEIIDIE